jgi:hypothetical protein
MRGKLFTSLVVAGLACASMNATRAATVSLPTHETTLRLHGAIENPFWITFALDADIQLLPGNGEGYVSHYFLNINLSTEADATIIQFAKIAGAEVENGLWPDGPPRLLFSDTMRTLHVDPSATFFNALLLTANLSATLPDGLYFALEQQEASTAVLSNNPVPAAAPLFVSGLGAIGFLIWRRSRKV